MKKVVRTVWISLLSGLAFLVACTPGNKLTRSQKKSLKAERATLIQRLEQHMEDEKSITDPQQLVEFKSSEISMRENLGEIDRRLKIEDDIDDNTLRIGTLNCEIDSLLKVIQEQKIRKTRVREPQPCVYGPPVR